MVLLVGIGVFVVTVWGMLWCRGGLERGTSRFRRWSTLLMAFVVCVLVSTATPVTATTFSLIPLLTTTTTTRVASTTSTSSTTMATVPGGTGIGATFGNSPWNRPVAAMSPYTQSADYSSRLFNYSNVGAYTGLLHE